MFTKKISAVAAAITAATALAVVNPSVADAATNYPKINRDYVSYSTDGETVVCGGSVNQDMFRCQTTAKWGNKKDAHNLVTFDLEDASGSWEAGMSGGNWDASRPPFRLKEGKKYSFHGIVVLNKNGTLYFSSPYHEVRGEVTPYEWEIMETD